MAYAIKNYADDVEVNRTAKIFIALGFTISVLIFIAAYPFIILFVKDSRFLEAIPLIGWFVVANLSMMTYLISSVIIPVSKSSKPIFKLQLFVSAAAILRLPILCYIFGVVGVVLSVVFSNLLFAILIRRSYRNYKLPNSYIALPLISILIVAVVYNYPIIELDFIKPIIEKSVKFATITES